MCTVLLRLDPGSPWPVVLAAVRDEFVERLWDPPAQHWSGPWSALVGGRDRQAGGTWLAVDPTTGRAAVAALLNGGRRDPLPDGATRPTRGDLALRVLTGGGVPEGAELEAYDRFHLLLATASTQELWTWDGEAMAHVHLSPGTHIVVNAGLDVDSDPLVPHFAPLLAEVAAAEVSRDWGGWPALLTGDGLPGDDDRALLVARLIEGRAYASTSAALVALSDDGQARYDFTATPADPGSWERVLG